MNRATADNQSVQSAEEGLEPTKEWVKDLIDEIIAEEFSSPDLELHWLDEDGADPETVLADRLKLGALTRVALAAALRQAGRCNSRIPRHAARVRKKRAFRAYRAKDTTQPGP